MRKKQNNTKWKTKWFEPLKRLVVSCGGQINGGLVWLLEWEKNIFFLNSGKMKSICLQEFQISEVSKIKIKKKIEQKSWIILKKEREDLKKIQVNKEK